MNICLGILDTIDEEWDEKKKNSLLNIFEKNYDHPSPSRHDKAKLLSPKKIRELKKKVDNPLKNYSPKSTNETILNIQTKAKSFPLKRVVAKQKDVYDLTPQKGRFHNHSVTRESNSSMFVSPDKTLQNSKYDPKKDRYKLLKWIMKKRSKSKIREKIVNDSILAKYTNSGRSHRYLSGQLSYSNIATRIASEKDGSINIKV